MKSKAQFRSHPIHPMLVAFPIALLTGTLAFDAVGWLTGGSAWVAAGVPLDGARDHGVSKALYLHNPDENGVELYWDRPREQWPRAPVGGIAMFTRRLDVDDLLGEVPS